MTVGNIVFCPMLGYALAKLPWRGKRLIMGLVLATLMVPAGITLIPNFVLIKNLGWLNTFPGIVAPFFLMTPFAELIKNGITIHRATAAFTVGDTVARIPARMVSAGTIWIGNEAGPGFEQTQMRASVCCPKALTRVSESSPTSARLP